MNVYSNTPNGVKLMRHLGFTEIVPKAPVPGLHDFIIEVERSGSPFIMRYKEEFRKWQEENIDSKVDSTLAIVAKANATPLLEPGQ